MGQGTASLRREPASKQLAQFVHLPLDQRGNAARTAHRSRSRDRRCCNPFCGRVGRMCCVWIAVEGSVVHRDDGQAGGGRGSFHDDRRPASDFDLKRQALGSLDAKPQTCEHMFVGGLGSSGALFWRAVSRGNLLVAETESVTRLWTGESIASPEGALRFHVREGRLVGGVGLIFGFVLPRESAPRRRLFLRVVPTWGSRVVEDVRCLQPDEAAVAARQRECLRTAVNREAAGDVSQFYALVPSLPILAAAEGALQAGASAAQKREDRQLLAHCWS